MKSSSGNKVQETVCDFYSHASRSGCACEGCHGNEQKTPDNHHLREDLYSDLDEEMEEVVCPYKVLDVAPLLQARYAFISGGKDKSGCPILTFPDNPQLPEVSEEDYKKVVTYLVNVPALFDAELGFSIIIDRRSEGWSAVKNVLWKISGYFPGKVGVVFVLKPSGFFARAFSDLRSKFKDDFSFKVVVCATPADLHEYIDPGQLTVDVGGEIAYDHNEWIQDRSAIEKFEANTSKIAQVLKRLSVRYEELELPNTVEGTEALMKDTFLERKEMLEDLTSATHHGGTILACVKGDNPHTPLVKVVHVVALERLLVQLEETQKSFDQFWNQHEEKLRQCLQLRKFEEKFKLLQFAVDRHVTWLESRMCEAGESLNGVESLIEQLSTFEESSKSDIEKAERLRESGEQLILEDHYAVDSIRPKCIELQRMCDQYKQLLRRRTEILERSRDLQDRIDRANKWCTKGVDLLATQQIEKFQTQEGAERALMDIESFLSTSAQLKLSNPKEFRALFESMITPETKAVVQSILKRIEDVQDMCDKRKNSLRRMTSRQRPVQPVTPDLRAPPKSPSLSADADLKRKKAEEINAQKKNVYEKSARLRVDIQHPGHHGYSGGSSPESLSSKSQSTSSLTDLESLSAKRRHVINELIETERTYVTELDDVLRGYCYEVDNPAANVPPVLKGKRDVLFGNLEQIYCFHNDIFIQDLQDCQNAPTLVGKCFLARKEEFQMYSMYCQNKPQAEALRTQVGDNHPFFKDCQRRLGHKLPLGAYLLKPVQRITKYQLLLKEMLKYIEADDESREELKEALEAMLSLLKHVNDLMHQIAIKGFPGELSDQGRLLMQGSFNVWTEHKKDKIKDLRFKPRHRHIFLYERSIVLCKKRDDGQHVEKGVYSFKNILKTAKVGLTENIKGDKKKFELWLPNREEVYTIQAPNMTVKEEWVKEVKKVLLNQFDQIKVQRRSSYHQLSEEDLSSERIVKALETSLDNISGFTESSWKSSHSNSSVPTGLERTSPLEPQLIEEDNGWSSGEFSNSEEEGWAQDNGAQQGGYSEHGYLEPSYMQQFSSLAEYIPMDPGELFIKEGDILNVLRVGTEGWWYAHHASTGQKGWVPASYLEPVSKRRSRSTISSSSLESNGGSHRKGASRNSLNSATSPGEETTV